MAEAKPQLQLRIGELLSMSWRDFKASARSLALPTLVTLSVYAGFRVLVPTIEDPWLLFGTDVLGLVVTTVVAYPWFLAALRAVDEDGGPDLDLARFGDQMVAAIFFWAGVMLGIRYLFGLPSLIVLVFYAFFGYAVADHERRRGLKALGWSVYIGAGNRVRVFVIGLLLGLVNLFALGTVAAGVNVVTIAVSAIIIFVTSNVTLVAGAHLYRSLEEIAA